MSRENVELVRSICEPWARGKVIRLVTYLDRAEALEAVGLRE